LQLDPQNELAATGLAKVFLATNQPAAGESVYAKMVVDNPKSSTAAVGLALIREAQHKDAEAEKGLSQFLTVVPDDVPVLKMVADLRFKHNDPSGAEAISRQIIKSHPDDPSSYMALASIYLLQKRPKDAMQQYREVLKRSVDDVVAENNLAWLIAENGGNIDEALALAQKSKEKAPNNPGIASTLGWIYLKKNNVNLALGEFQQAVREDPKNQEILYHLGVAQFRSGKLEDARRTLTAALTGNPSYSGVNDARRILEIIQRGK
jgi:predicted Zn-dependent protease